jgi:hypothetical protein
MPGASLASKLNNIRKELNNSDGSVALSGVLNGCCILVGVVIQKKASYFKYSCNGTSLNYSEQFHRGSIVPWNKG